MKSQVYDDINNKLKKTICNDHDKVKWENNPLRLVPQQHFNTINTNSLGFRGSEFDIVKSEDTFRIFVIGGSTIFGVGSTSDSTTIPGYLQTIFEKNDYDSKIEIINAGIPKAYSFTEVEFIKNEIIQYKPDLLIIYDGWNDIRQPYDSFGGSPDFKLSDQIARIIQKNDLFKTPQVLLKSYIYWKINSDPTIFHFDEMGLKEKTTQWSQNWNEICSLGQENNFKVIITLQPILGTGNKTLTTEEKDHFQKYDHTNLILYYDEYAKSLYKLKNCTSVMDIRDSFDMENDTIFWDGGHTGDKGNLLIAKKLYDLSLPHIITKFT